MYAARQSRTYKFNEYGRAICFVCNTRPADIIYSKEMCCARCYLNKEHKENEVVSNGRIK